MTRPAAEVKAPSPKTRVVSFRLRADAYERLTQQSAAAGLSTRAWMEQAILEDRTKLVTRSQPSPDYKALLFQVNKAGNNLNHIANRLHSLALSNILEADRWLSVLDELTSIEGALMDVLVHARAD